ncbi:MAG TPA: hypothetical protein PLJ21_03050 [Pseudobdellovibrionaceae bacterium]|nr:hypothetical protein [Pseudobdellovibrionaceae bacterium]
MKTLNFLILIFFLPLIGCDKSTTNPPPPKVETPNTKNQKNEELKALHKEVSQNPLWTSGESDKERLIQRSILVFEACKKQNISICEALNLKSTVLELNDM